MILGFLLISGFFIGLAQASEIPTTTNSISVSNITQVPENPVGFIWPDTPDWGNDGDQLYIYAEIDSDNPLVRVQVNNEFCTPAECLAMFSPACYGWYQDDMDHLGGNLYGLWYKSWWNDDSWGAGIYVNYNITFEDDTGQVFWWPENATINSGTFQNPPTNTEVTAQVEPTTVYPGQDVWINGTANHTYSEAGAWNNTIPMETTNVTIKVGGDTHELKTDLEGNYSLQITAPTTPDSYEVNITVQNDTVVRSITGYAEPQFDVVLPVIDASLHLNTTTTLPEQQLWASGTVTLDGAPAPAGLEVTAEIPETGDSWIVATDANGDYAAQINAPNITGDFTVNITAVCPTYSITAWNDTVFMVVAVPLPDLVASPLNITLTGNQVGGVDLHVGIAVYNYGIATAVDAQINISLDGELLDSSRYTIAPGEWMENGLTWLQVIGTHNITVEADPAGEIEESSELNNIAWKEFEVLEDFDGDGTADIDDLDDDDDGVPDSEDDFPLNPDETTDTDGDETGDNEDEDDDNDDVPDNEDAFPLNSTEWSDLDGDDIGDNSDQDIDGDDVNNDLDAFPLDDTEWADYDGDDIGDNADLDDDSDGLDDATEDPYPMDTDNDGLVNSMDQDDDGDGIPDISDTMPLDTDNDGTNNGEDADIDGDGVENAEDAFPLDENEDTDTDDDGIGNNEDDDDDDDGVLDEDDAAPLNPEISEHEAETQDPSTMAVIAIIAIAAILVAVILIYPGFKS